MIFSSIYLFNIFWNLINLNKFYSEYKWKKILVNITSTEFTLLIVSTEETCLDFYPIELLHWFPKLAS